MSLPDGWIRGSDAPRSRPVKWLVQDRLARGHVTYLFGNEGIGKSTWWVHEAAKITAQRQFVVLIITEDGWEDSVRPRAEAAGVDLDFVLVLNVAEDDDDFEMGIPGPGWLIGQELPDVALVVIDGLADATAVVNGGLPKATEWRPVITAWKRYARRRGAAVLALGHTNRDTLNGTRGAVGLSGQIRQTVRLNLLAQRDEDGRLAIGVEKSNICRDDLPADLYEITETAIGGIATTVATPVGIAEQSAKEMFSTLAALPQVAEDEATIERLDGCIADLVLIVESECDGDGWIETTHAQELLQKGKGKSTAKWSPDQIARARTRAIKEKFIEADHPKVPGPWFWRRLDA
ncbi:AAA family ATPase [Gordonia sp. DT219]|uniref:AAA family ATPase n=1 Tax=Gordonia sp. DT219 TaxID=3416658 RepID=UPI003CFA13C3